MFKGSTGVNFGHSKTGARVSSKSETIRDVLTKIAK